MDKPRVRHKSNGSWVYEHQGVRTWGRSLQRAYDNWVKFMETRANEEKWELERKMVRDVDDGEPFIGGVPRTGYRRESMDRFSEVMLITIMGVAAATVVYLVCAWIGRLAL